MKKSWLAYLQLRSIRFVVLVAQCTIPIVHGSSQMQPIVRFMYFLQLLHIIGMLIRRETTANKGTNITVGQAQDCDNLPACHMDYSSSSSSSSSSSRSRSRSRSRSSRRSRRSRRRSSNRSSSSSSSSSSSNTSSSSSSSSSSSR